MPHSDHDRPLSKRQKLDAVVPAGNNKRTEQKAPVRGSRIFAPFRTVGLVSPTNVPFTSIPLGKTTFQITTSVGRSLQTYDLKRGLNLVFITRPQTPADITATTAWKEKVLAAWGRGGQGGGQGGGDQRSNDDGNNNDGATPAQGVWVFQRGKKVAELDLPADLDQPVRQLLVFGSWIVGCARTRIEVWKSATLEHYTTLFPAAAKPGDNELTGGVRTMPTYLNKIFVGRRDGWVEIWNVSTGKLVYTILPPSPGLGAVTCLEPTPALSLLAIAYAEGPLVVHNVLTDKTVLRVNAGLEDAPVTTISFRTDGLGAGQDGRKDGVMATATEPSGDVTFWDLNKGGRIMGVLRGAHNPRPHPSSTTDDTSAGGGGISKVKFLPGQPVLLTSGRDNSLKSWIFDETPFSPVPRILHARSGHAGPVTCLQFLPSDFDGADGGNKWLLSGGRDRSLWGWSLRRDGQSTELSQGNLRKKARKFGILASSSSSSAPHPSDRSRGPSTMLDDLKAPEITCIASSLNRDGGIGAIPGKQVIWQKGQGDKKNRPTNAEISAMTGWESVVTGHKDDPYARTWFWGRKRAGRWALATGDGSNVSTVAITPCGTFALVGSVGGAVDMFNLQSGLHRQRFPSRLTPAQARQLKMTQLMQQTDKVAQLQTRGGTTTKFLPGAGKHTRAVTGIAVDSLNQTVVTCSLDGTVKFWDFLTGNLADQLDWRPTAVTACRYHAANDLIAFACDDGAVRVVDLETRKTIREFHTASSPSHNNSEKEKKTITDLAFSPDGRWIVASTREDHLLRVWDLPTSHLIDAFRLDRACSALAFSGSGEYLAAAAEGELGVRVWTNRALFRHVAARRIGEAEVARLAVAVGPTVSGEGGEGVLEGAFDEEDDEEDDGGVADDVTVDQLSKDMLTLSLVPKSRWQTLLHIDLIKQRNKPKEPPRKPERAPFFLPSVGGGPNPFAPVTAAGDNNITAGGGDTGEKNSESAISRITTLDRNRAEEAFSSRLRRGAVSGDYTPFIEHLKTLPPSAADLELRSLSPGPDGPDDESPANELLHFVRALTARLAARRDYELAQAWMAVFLRLHADDLLLVAGSNSNGSSSTPLAAALHEWRACQARERDRLDGLVGYCGGVVGFLRSPRT